MSNGKHTPTLSAMRKAALHALDDTHPFGLVIDEYVVPCESLNAAQAMYLALAMLYRRDYGKALGERHISGPKRGYRIDGGGRVWAGKRKVLA